MYGPEDDRSVYLGLPSKGKIVAHDADLLKISHVGGNSVWYDGETAPSSSEDLVCQVCSASSQVTLVAKVYAPVEKDRSLYVFCCNKRTCSLQHSGWIVIRNQEEGKSLGKPSNISNERCEAILATSSTSKESPKTLWSFDKKQEEDEDDDLLALLAARDLSISKPAAQSKGSHAPSSSFNKKGKGQTSPPSAPSKPTQLTTPVTLPLITLSGEEEEWDEEYYKSALEADVHEEHIDRLIATYLKDEEDTDNISALHQAGLGSSSSAIKLDSDCLANTKEAYNRREEDEEDGEDTLLKGADEVEGYFQSRVQAYPNQVLRYAYEGQPLWISSPNPLQSKSASIPVCELCGAERVFECQLMPALLSHLKEKKAKIFSSHIETSDANLDIKQRLKHMLGSSIDFGVVTIWSCPNSCAVSAGSYAREIAIVQPPPDTLTLDL